MTMNNVLQRSPHEAIPVFLAADERYAPYAAIMMRSVLLNTRSRIDFYIMANGIRPETQAKVVATCAPFPHARLEFIDMGASELRQFQSMRHLTVETYSRYFIAELKPEISKAVYVDVDIIARGDIADLYAQPLDGHPLGVVPTDASERWPRQLMALWPDYRGKRYFNAGVLVMDVAWFRRNDATRRLVQLTHAMKDVLMCADQDALNVFFQEDLQLLDARFNYNTKERLEEPSAPPPVLLHFANQFKPWNSFTDAYSKYFRTVAKETVFWEDIHPVIASGILSAQEASIPRGILLQCRPLAVLLLRLRLARFLVETCIKRESKKSHYVKKANAVRNVIRAYKEYTRDASWGRAMS